jgi:hypothetical protein
MIHKLNFFNKTITGSDVIRKLYQTLFITNFLCIFVILTNGFGDHIYSALAFIFLMIASSFYFYTKNNPLAHLTIFQATLFLSIPISLSTISDYDFSSQIRMPHSNEDYLFNLKNSILYLTVFYLLIFIGLKLGMHKGSLEKKIEYYKPWNIKNILLIMPFYLIIDFYSIIKSTNNYINRFDITYVYQKINLFEVFLNPLSLIIVCVCSIEQYKKNSKEFLLIFFLIIIYFFNNSYTGSRSALLSIILYFYLIPSFIKPDFNFRGAFNWKLILLIIYYIK